MLFADRLTLDAPRRTQDGYLAVRARAARTGVYQYSGREVDPDNAHGLRDQASVNVLREATDVFDRASLGSFVGKPITDDHPREAVTANNWRDHARGVIMGAVKDGEHIGFDLAFHDAATIAKLDAGKVELSNGYDASLEFGKFTAADGTECPVKQTNIRGNHVALVARGRAGSSCRIGDAALCGALPPALFPKFTDQEKPVKKILLDGLTVDIADTETAEATIRKLETERNDARGKLTDADTKVATLTTDKATLEAKVTTLEQAVNDAKPTPAQLRDAGKALMLAAGRAKALGVAVMDTMDETQIMAATVKAKMGDAAKDWNADQVAASFAVLTKDVKVGDAAAPGLSGQPINFDDARARRDAAVLERNQSLRDGYKAKEA